MSSEEIISLQIENEMLREEKRFLIAAVVEARMQLHRKSDLNPASDPLASVPPFPQMALSGLGAVDQIILKALPGHFDVAALQAAVLTRGVQISALNLRRRLHWLKDRGLVKHVEATDSWWIVQHA